MSGKRCSECGVMKRVEHFSRNRSKKHGLQSQCKACRRRRYAENREAELGRQNRYNAENREARRGYQRRYREENREAVLESKRRYYEENHEEVLERQRRYCEENREAILERKRRQYDENYKMTRESATRTGERYTPAEDAHILASDEPAAVIAVELGRTLCSVSARRKRLRKAVSA